MVFFLRAFPQFSFLVAFLLALPGSILAAHRRSKLLSIVAAAVLIVASMGVAISVSGRSAVQSSVPAPAAGQLRVLSWNTNQQDVSEEQVEDIVRLTSPSVVVLPEYFPQAAVRSLAGLAKARGMQVLGSESSSATLLVSNSLGRYRIAGSDSTPAWAGFLAEPDSGVGPSILAAHLQRPSLGSSSEWQRHAEWVRQACNSRPNLIAVGDFNADNGSLGNGSLGGCRDAAESLGIDSAATWPTFLPASLGATIDHVMSTGEWHAKSYSVVGNGATGGSDHRPIFAVLTKSS